MYIRNFLFHRVTEEKDALWPPMKPVLFEKIIKKLTRQYCVVSLETVFDNACSNALKNKKPLATVLFDDGYKDNIEYAAPILKKYNCPASFYVATDCIDRNVPTWTYIIDFCLQKTNVNSLALSFDYVPAHLRYIHLSNGITPAIKELKPWMKSLPNTKRIGIMSTIIEQCYDIQLPNHLMMNWDEVRELHQNGFVVGSHTRTHPMLAQLENTNEIEEELTISFKTILKEIGTAPKTISYPIGSYDQRVIDLSQKVGYTLGLAVEQRFFNTALDNHFAIPRVELYQEPWYKVATRIHGFYNAVKRIWK